MEPCEGNPFGVACDVDTVAREPVATCGGGYRVRELDATLSGPLYEDETCDLMGDACEPVGDDEVLYRVGAEIPVDSLVTVVDDDQVE